MAKFLDNWKNKVTTYKNKAEEIRAMIEEGAETIRDIRADVEGTVEDLKADSEEKMMESLEKIQDAERVFKEAGYLLSAIELEMGFNPKVVAVLKRESEIGSRKKERLLKQHEDNKVLSTMLASLFKAEALEDKVHLRRLTFSEVHIEMGLVPAVHVLWEDKAASGISSASILPIEESSSSSGSSSASPNSSTRSSRANGGIDSPSQKPTAPACCRSAKGAKWLPAPAELIAPQSSNCSGCGQHSCSASGRSRHSLACGKRAMLP